MHGLPAYSKRKRVSNTVEKNIHRAFPMVASTLFADRHNNAAMSQNDLLKENMFSLQKAKGAGSYVQAIASVAV